VSVVARALGRWFVVIATVAGCSAGSPATVTQRFDDARVEARVHFERASEFTGVVIAEFTPTGRGIHLYGLDLPAAGIDGAGRPTRIEVVDDRWRPAGTLTASTEAELIDYPGFDEPFPVFPEGPVTLRQAVERSGATDDGSIAATVTFMACTSTGLCYVPVVAQPVAIPTR
jgi:hypothetical protein